MAPTPTPIAAEFTGCADLALLPLCVGSLNTINPNHVCTPVESGVAAKCVLTHSDTERMSPLTLNPQIRTTSLPVSALSAAAAAALASGGGSPVASPLRRRVSSATSFASSGILSLVNGGSPAASPSGLSILHSATAPQLFTRGRNPRGGEGSAAGSPATGASLLRESNLSAMRSTAAGDESLMGHGRIHSAMPDPGGCGGLGCFLSLQRCLLQQRVQEW